LSSGAPRSGHNTDQSAKRRSPLVERGGPGVGHHRAHRNRLVKDEQAAARFIELISGLGCKLALDDFGTGYASFTYLKRLPVDFLKIDYEFVRDVVDNPASRHVVDAVVRLARDFGQQTIAEGAEDERTLRALKDLGVDFAQGYAIARPRPVAEVLPIHDDPHLAPTTVTLKSLLTKT
jgi:EAL domain-containing protein (putative c-di-GMP-specific phosphodiesterase class I)